MRYPRLHMRRAEKLDIPPKTQLPPAVFPASVTGTLPEIQRVLFRAEVVGSSLTSLFLSHHISRPLVNSVDTSFKVHVESSPFPPTQSPWFEPFLTWSIMIFLLWVSLSDLSIPALPLNNLFYVQDPECGP